MANFYYINQLLALHEQLIQLTSFPPYTSVANPENAIERRAAVIKRIGAPLKSFGTGAASTLSLNPARRTRESIKPNAEPAEYVNACKKE